MKLGVIFVTLLLLISDIIAFLFGYFCLFMFVYLVLLLCFQFIQYGLCFVRYRFIDLGHHRLLIWPCLVVVSVLSLSLITRFMKLGSLVYYVIVVLISDIIAWARGR